jgi:hypothetical protein
MHERNNDQAMIMLFKNQIVAYNMFTTSSVATISTKYEPEEILHAAYTGFFFWKPNTK